MKRRLILMRHAKSSWESSATTDHARPLNGRGRRSAPLVGARLEELGWVPELVVSSDAARTRETWELLAPAFGGQAIVVCFSPELYGAGLREIRSLAKEWDVSVGTVLLLGHNPGFEGALHALSRERHEMTTANAALLSAEGASWASALAGSWSLEHLIRPRDLE
ncbi:MAG: histidine phosphatase family protein [Planctomycetota bacterium]